MQQQQDGLVINISSWAGIYNSPVVGPAYNGSKHAVVSITETLNMEECKNGIRACAICPAEVDTPIMEQRPVPPSAEVRARMLRAEDLGRTICWVAMQPPHMCVNEIIVSPAWNRFYTGTGD
jgi:NADP-dependent 3-hydroxy acid dehydrogenase YdfG